MSTPVGAGFIMDSRSPGADSMNRRMRVSAYTPMSNMAPPARAGSKKRLRSS